MTRRVIPNCWGSSGDVFPYVGLAKALQARGHSPLGATSAYDRQAGEHEGIEFAAGGPDVDPTDRELIARVMHPTKGSERIVRELLLPVLPQTYEELRRVAAGAHLLISHPITYAAPVLAQREGLPWVSTVLAPMLFFSVTDLPVFPHAPRLVHLRGLGAWFGRTLVGLVRRATRDWMEPVYRLRAELGLPRGADPLFEGQFSPQLTLALFSRVLAEPQPDWPPHVQTTGFVFYNGPDALDPALEDFLATGPAPVVFTLGTSAVGAAGTFYQESAAAAAHLGVRAVLLTGGFAQNRPPEPLPPGVLLADKAPHQLLFPRASAIVHQGGIGTTAQALRSGRPMLVVPHGHDQPDNAFRVGNLGVARSIIPRRYRAARVARELDALLHEPRYRQQAAAMAAAVRAEGGASAAAAALEPLLA
jgi:UDP:flavonoid glycosyltransferase YjiC (YdhE family)